MQRIHSNNLFHLGAIPSIAAIALCASAQARAIGTEDEIFQKPLQSEFNQLDTNRDHLLSQREAVIDVDFSGSFKTADANGDGALAIDEYNAFKSQAQQARIQTYLDDSTVTAKIKAELIRDAGMHGLDISVETHHGDVILSGFVDNQRQLRRAMQIASGIRGVRTIKNGLVIKS
ncbi:MAG TPA: BON domain-containing protein [Methylophilaceae bacterium]|nr:BON domain-containing protein [Methylophilaceae bacterium]